MNVLPESFSPVSVLLLVMLGVAVLQLPFVRLPSFFRKKGLWAGALTRVPNAAGLWTEALAARQNLLLFLSKSVSRAPSAFLSFKRLESHTKARSASLSVRVITAAVSYRSCFSR